MVQADFMVEQQEDLRVASMDLRPMPRQAPIPERSAASITAEPPAAFLRAGSRALVEVSTAVVEVFTAAVVMAAEVTGDPFRLLQAQPMIGRNKSCSGTI